MSLGDRFWASRLVPRWGHSSPRLFKFLIGLFLLHVGTGYAFAVQTGRHKANVYQVLSDLAPLWVWGVAHLVLAAVVLIGIYAQRTALLWALRLSITVFSSLACAYWFAFIHTSDVSILGASVYTFVAGVCALFLSLSEGRGR